MSIYTIIVAGVFATACMTAFVYFLSVVTDQRLRVIRVLGTMLTGQTSRSGKLSWGSQAFVVGTVVHFMIGIGFAVLYRWLWSNGVGSPFFGSAVLFGIISGIVGAAGWRMFIALHPHPPVLPIKLYLLAIAAAHVIFALGVVIFVKWWPGL